MTIVMGISELIYIYICYKLSHQVVPQMQICIAHFTTDVLPELLRFAGSYQLVNVLEVLYAAILPVAILKVFGATAAGLLAVVTRAVTAALIAQEALALPILSGGTFIFASGCTERVGLFISKSFKITILSAIPALSLLAAFGPTLILVWTGQTDHALRLTIFLCSIAALFKAISLLQLILYRASGKAFLDNIRQLLRIAIILGVAFLSSRLGFEGVLVGMAFAELTAVVFMFFVMKHEFAALDVKRVAGDAMRICTATALIISCGALVGSIPNAWNLGERLAALVRLSQILIGCLIIAWPAITLTKCLSAEEQSMLIDAVLMRKRSIRATADIG
jgi:O-antigen/teichoic acid export membrane protein